MKSQLSWSSQTPSPSESPPLFAHGSAGAFTFTVKLHSEERPHSSVALYRIVVVEPTAKELPGAGPAI